ncbi:MAG: DUF502 domain-containing protein [Haloarculaceae archaeon]
MRLGKVLRDSFVAGAALVAPLVVTVIALRFLVGWLTTFIDPIVAETRLAAYTANIQVVAQGLALVLILLVIVVLGYFAQRSFGRRLFDWVDRGIGLVPLVRIVYSSVRQVSNALLERSNRYESVVLVEYPRDGIYSVGFITGDSPAPVEAVADAELVNVFLPNSPNPTGGRMAMVPVEQVHEVDMSVRRGVRLLVTTGIAEDDRDVKAFQAEADVEPAATAPDVVRPDGD